MSKKKDERQFKIRQLLQEHPKIKISDLSDYFQTSSETIRKDIIELEDSKIIKKEHGYVLLLEEPDEMPISLRNQEYIEEKKQIMKQTCTFIKEGMVVYLDAGSTCQAGIPFLHPVLYRRIHHHDDCSGCRRAYGSVRSAQGIVQVLYYHYQYRLL